MLIQALNLFGNPSIHLLSGYDCARKGGPCFGRQGTSFIIMDTSHERNSLDLADRGDRW